MDGQVVRRRVNTVASHITSHEDISATATHLFPLICSKSLHSVSRRRDSRMHFARQGSSSQAFFMRPTTNEQGRCVQPTPPLKSTSCTNMDLYAYEAPTFSRPARLDHSLQNVGGNQSQLRGHNYPQPVPKAPCFAQPSRRDPQFHSEKRIREIEK